MADKVPADAIALHRFIEDSKEGYAIYSAEDRIIYCNAVFADFYRLPVSGMVGLHFDELIRYCHKNKVGSKIDDPDVENFLSYVRTVRRCRPYRAFEVDFYDGRWFLISEQINSDGELLQQMKELTKQKLTLQYLEHSVESLSEIALTDELTKAANRRGFVQAVERELDRGARNDTPSTLALIDLDHFKPINDRFGHLVGDQILVHLSNQIQSQLRPYDVFGRIGGDEFALFLGDTNHAQAIEICERIRNTVEGNPMQVEASLIDLALSIGVTSQQASVRFEQLYQEADAALYRAKAQGRNCVQSYQAG